MGNHNPSLQGQHRGAHQDECLVKVRETWGIRNTLRRGPLQRRDKSIYLDDKGSHMCQLLSYETKNYGQIHLKSKDVRCCVDVLNICGAGIWFFGHHRHLMRLCSSGPFIIAGMTVLLCVSMQWSYSTKDHVEMRSTHDITQSELLQKETMVWSCQRYPQI